MKDKTQERQKLKFYFSAKQAELSFMAGQLTYNLFKDKQYTECISSDSKKTHDFDDSIYLGEGTFADISHQKLD